MGKRAVLYARVSSDDRSKDGRNLESQLDMGREYCQKQGYTVIAELPEDDRGASGASWDLPQLNQALAMARAAQFDILVVRELDRFARSLAKQLVIETEFKRAGVEIEYILAQYEDSPEGQLSKHVRAVIAEYEREKIKERMVRGRLNKVKSGQVMGAGSVAYGYRLAEVDEKQTFAVYEPEAQIVRLIYAMYTGAERVSIRAIVKKLQAMGVVYNAEGRNVRKRQDPCFWSATTVKGILSNETYVGVWHYAGIAVSVPAIVDREQFDIAQERKRENQATARRNRKYQYLLSGRVRCGICGEKMQALTCMPRGKPFSYYYCPANIDHVRYKEHCENKRYRVDIIEPLVWAAVKEWLADPQQVREEAERFKTEKDAENHPLLARLAVVIDRLADTQARKDTLFEMRVNREINSEKFKTQDAIYDRIITDLETERAALQAEIEKTSITAEQINDLVTFCGDVNLAIGSGDADPEVQTRAYNALHLTVTLTLEEGEQVVYVYCILGEKRLSVAGRAIHPAFPCSGE